MKKVTFGLLAVIFLLSFVSSYAVCGNSFCEAGLRMESGEIEDASTCYEDCSISGHKICEIDSASGSGTCNVGGEEYKFSDVSWSGCGHLDDVVMNMVVSKGESTVTFEGIIPENYIRIMDGLSVAIERWPCSGYTSTKRIYARVGYSTGDLDKNFIKANKQSFVFGETLEITYEFPFELTMPYCRTTVINNENGESMTSLSVLGCQKMDAKIDGEIFNPGKYTIESTYFEETGEKEIDSDSLDIIVHGCVDDSQCKSFNFFKKGTCDKGEFNTCSSELNATILIGAIIIALLVLILLVSLLRKR